MSKAVTTAVVVTLVTLVASTWWLSRSELTPELEPGRPVAKSRPVTVPNLLTNRARQASPAGRSDRPAVVAESSWDPQLLQKVERKYRFLWTDLRLSAGRMEELRELLLQYEQLRDVVRGSGGEEQSLDAVERGRMDRALANLDARIRALLDPAQYARFEGLRDSDIEQEHLTQYSGGISDLEPLSPSQERAILEARLRHKKRFEAGLRDFGLDRNNLSVEERSYAHSNVAQALSEYRDNFLAEVRPTLTEEQYFLLSSYESTEFARELEKMQMLINSK